MSTFHMSFNRISTTQKRVAQLYLGLAVDANALILGQIVARVRGLEQCSAATTFKTDLIDGYLVENTKEG